MKTFFKRLYMILIIIFMYAPIVTLMVLSFNASKSRGKWGGFTLSWYSSLFQNSDIMNALFTTLLIAVLSSVIATIIGTAGAIGINSMKLRTRSAMLAITNIPMLNADIVTGISLMLFFIACRFTLGFSTILIAHITFNIPYVILNVMPRLKQTSKSTYEAALDLGASHFYTFRKIVFPDIFPGIISGFLMAFTMSLDDFIITYFSKGPGVDTLSTKIYSEVRKGIKPEIYALSTLMFVAVILLLILTNIEPNEKQTDSRHSHSHSKPVKALSDKALKRKKTSRFVMRRVVPGIIVMAIIVSGIYYGTKSGHVSGDNQLIIYNWGEYMEPEVLEMFEEETGIEIVYEEFETNEIMYPKIMSGAISYDLVCPSDYMIQRMIEEDLLQEIDLTELENYKYISNDSLTMSQYFDPENKYSVPYLWGTVGILYNTGMVDEPVDSWDILWDEKYADSILMQDSVRDAYCVALKKLGYSVNSKDLDEMRAATDLLIEQKPLVQAYVIDQVRDKMIGNEAALGVIFSGEALICVTENTDLEFTVPKEGTNVWIDSFVIPKNAKHVENAMKFLDFICRPEIAAMNFEYTGYAIANDGGKEIVLNSDIPNAEVAFPTSDDVANAETYNYLGDEWDRIYNEFWKEVKSE